MGPVGLGWSRCRVMADTEKNTDIVLMRAAAEIRAAAARDKKRATELSGVADYLESIVHEKELDEGWPPFAEAEPDPMDEEIKKMMKPFKVRLTR